MPSMSIEPLLVIPAVIGVLGLSADGAQAAASRPSVVFLQVAQDASSPETSWPGTESEAAPTPKAAPNTSGPGGAARLRQLLGPPPNISTSIPPVNDATLASYAYSKLVFRKVTQACKKGVVKGMPGAASVAFRLGDRGEVADAHIVRGSGHPDFDQEAVATVKRGAPYPPPPASARRDFAITLRFQAK